MSTHDTDDLTHPSRRSIITGAGKIVAGATLISLLNPDLSSAAHAKAPTPPWPYKKLKTSVVGQLAYEYWYKNFCSSAVVVGILLPLQQEVGEPYTSFPIDAFRFGHGGMVGWGTFCGTLTGAGIVTSLVAGQKDGERMLNDIATWYTNTSLPNFKPKNAKANIKNTNQSDSPLCHISVGKWMEKEHVKFFSPERKERCARLSADVAMHTVELLNRRADGKYKPQYPANNDIENNGIPAQNNCDECHQEVPEPLK